MPLDPWTKDDFLDLFRDLFPREFVRPLEEDLDGEGLDIYSAFAAIFARVDAALNYTTQRYYLKPHTLQTGEPAAGGAKATGTLNIARTAPVNQLLELVAGTQFVATYRDSRGATRFGATYDLRSDLAFAAGDLGPLAAVADASRIGFEPNVDPESIELFQSLGTSEIEDATVTAPLTEVANAGTRDRLDAGMVGRFILFDAGPNATTIARIESVDATLQTAVVDRALLAGVGDARVVEFADLGLTVTQPAAFTGGTDAWLDAIGVDRKTFRVLGESDDAYRERLCDLPDVVSPNAIIRIANRILNPLGIRFVLKETRDTSTWPGFIYDVDPYDVFGPFQGYVGGCDLATSFVICVSGIGVAGDFGLTYDDGHTEALEAYDVDGAYDGASLGYNAAIGALFDAVNAARAAGVCFDIVLDLAL